MGKETREQEDKYLYQQKVREGMDTKIALRAVKSFRKSQKDFVILKREKKKLETAVKNLTKKNDYYKKKVYDLETKIRNIKKYNTEKKGKAMLKEQISKEEATGSLLYVKRIIHFMEENKEYTQTSIAKSFGIPVERAKEALEFLSSINMIKKINNGRQRTYTKI